MFQKNFIPFVRTPTDVIPHILNALKLDEQSVLYDLGCGDGKIIATCHRIHPDTTYIGIEKKCGHIIWDDSATEKRFLKNLT